MLGGAWRERDHETAESLATRGELLQVAPEPLVLIGHRVENKLSTR